MLHTEVSPDASQENLEQALRDIQGKLDSDVLFEVLRRHHWNGHTFDRVPVIASLRADLESVRELESNYNT